MRLCLALAATILFMALAGPAEALDRQVRIVNASSFEIVELYGSRVDARTPRNILGEATLPAGASVDVDFEDGSGYCMYNFRAVFDDGAVLERRRVNVCEVGTFRYTD